MSKLKIQKKDETKKILQEAIDEIKQRFGEGAIMNLKEISSVDIDAISTSSISLDMILGVGGVPRGRVIEIYLLLTLNMLWILITLKKLELM